MDSSSSHVFSVDLLVDHASKGHGVVTSMAAGNDVIVLGTSRGFLIRYDFNLGNSFGPFPNPTSPSNSLKNLILVLISLKIRWQISICLSAEAAIRQFTEFFSIPAAATALLLLLAVVVLRPITRMRSGRSRGF